MITDVVSLTLNGRFIQYLLFVFFEIFFFLLFVFFIFFPFFDRTFILRSCSAVFCEICFFMFTISLYIYLYTIYIRLYVKLRCFYLNPSCKQPIVATRRVHCLLDLLLNVRSWKYMPTFPIFDDFCLHLSTYIYIHIYILYILYVYIYITRLSSSNVLFLCYQRYVSRTSSMSAVSLSVPVFYIYVHKYRCVVVLSLSPSVIL